MWYVTIKRAENSHQGVRLLLGPYETRREADANIRTGYTLACAVNEWHHFDIYGVAYIEAAVPPVSIFGK